MAQRRMFSNKIIDTDLFLDMPASSQVLYLHLAMRADDDGFISSPKKIMKMLPCSDDDMKILIAKSFLIPFDSGVCVIKHWKIHNYIQKDRYSKTLYTEELRQLSSTDEGIYELPTNILMPVDNMDTKCIQNVSSLDTQVRLGKDSLELGEDSIDIGQMSDKCPDKEKPKKTKFLDTVTLTQDEHDKLVEKYGDSGANRIIEILDNYKGANGKSYKSDYKAIQSWVIERYEKEVSAKGGKRIGIETV